MTTNNHPAHGPVSLDRLHQIREILSKAAAQSEGGNLGYAMADAVKVIDGAIAAFGAEPVGYTDEEELRSADNDIWMWKSPHGFGNDIPLYAAPRPASIVSVMYKGIELLTIDGLELIRDGMAEPTGLEAMCMAKALLSAPPTPAVTQNHHKWSPGLVHPEDCQCGDCRSAKLNHQSSNSFTDEDLEGMIHGNNPQSNAYRELLAFRRNSPVTPDGWVMVPKRLTAENGAKGVLSGEFSETKFINCPECFGDDECEICDGSGRIEITVPVTWTTIKAIWAKGVEHFAAAPQQEVKP